MNHNTNLVIESTAFLARHLLFLYFKDHTGHAFGAEHSHQNLEARKVLEISHYGGTTLRQRATPLGLCEGSGSAGLSSSCEVQSRGILHAGI